MGYVMELQSDGEVLKTAYKDTLKDVRTVSKHWKPKHRRLVFLAQAPRKHKMLAEGGQCIASFRLPSMKMAYIYVSTDTETVERHIARLRKKMETQIS